MKVIISSNWLVLIVALLILQQTTSLSTLRFPTYYNSNTKTQPKPIPLDPTFVKPNVIEAGITEKLCIDTAQRMQRVMVPVSSSIHPDEQVGISYAFWPATNQQQQQQQQQRNLKNMKSSSPVVVLVHGFDSSNLEFRRLGSRLASRGVETYAVDLLGWGYTQLEGVKSFSASAKVEALNGFLQTVVGTDRPFCIAGASLGGAAAIEVCTQNTACQGLILIDAQGFVDGVGMMSLLPKPIANLGVQVLKSIPLRSSANQMTYYDKTTYATDEAVTVGRLHCLRDGWSDGMVSFMQSGGFTPSKLVSQISVPTLLLWGRQDGILDGTEWIPKFLTAIPNAMLQWIEECGHVPHLEQPDTTANAITEFLTTLTVDQNGMNQGSSNNPFATDNSTPQTILVATSIGIVGAITTLTLDYLPTF